MLNQAPTSDPPTLISPSSHSLTSTRTPRSDHSQINLVIRHIHAAGRCWQGAQAWSMTKRTRAAVRQAAGSGGSKTAADPPAPAHADADAGNTPKPARKRKTPAAAAARGGAGAGRASKAAAAKAAGRSTAGSTAGSTAAAAGVGGAAHAAGGKAPYFLVKSEPDEFSIQDLAARPHQTEGWEGVRNYQARNILRSMRLGDQALFYHSSCPVPGVVGIVQVVREAYPDATARQPGSKYYDAKASDEDPRWWQVDFKLVRVLARQITLQELRAHHQQHAGAGGPLAAMALFNRPRLSVQPVTAAEWEFVLSLEEQRAGGSAKQG